MQLRRAQKTLILYRISVFTLVVSALFPTPLLASSGSFGWVNSRDAEMNLKTQALPPEPAKELTIPVLLGVEVVDLEDTWGDARSGGRKHEGVDIMAPTGTPIVSPTEAVVTRIDTNLLGGKVVYTANPGKETYYYAHLSAFAEGLEEGDILAKGDLIGYVGSSGNASDSAPHLHFTIFDFDGEAMNPFPRLTQAFSETERADISAKIALVKIEAQKEASLLKEDTGSELANISKLIKRDLKLGMKGSDVEALQEFLIEAKAGPQALALAKMGATAYFGNQTKKALAEYQSKAGIAPASGYFGPKTKEYVTKVAVAN